MLQHWSQGLQIGFPNLMVSFSSALGPTQVISNLGQIEKIFSFLALTPSVILHLRLISTFAPIGMRDLS
jgi:hypothetical protein